MKKKLFRFLGAILVAVVLVTYFLAPALPAQAAVLSWSGGEPTNGQTGVSQSPTIFIIASEAINPSTARGSNVTLQLCAGEVDASRCSNIQPTNLCTASLTNNDTQIGCTLTGELSANTTYMFTVGTSVLSASTNQGAVAAVVRIFRTGGQVLPLTWSGGGPGNGQMYVPNFPLVDITASEAIAPATATTGNVKLYSCTGANDASACSSPVTATNYCTAITLANANANLQCVLAGPLSVNTTYKFIVGTAVQGASSLLGAEAEVARIFRTSEFDPSSNQTPPFIQNTNPASGYQNFSPNGNLTVQFSSPMKSDGSTNAVNNSANIILQTAVNGAPSGSNLCASNGCVLTYVSNYNELKIDPAVNLTNSTNYVLTVMGNVVNMENRPIGGNFMLFFKTSATTDSVAPTFTTFPATVTTGTPGTVNQDISDLLVQFSEPMNQSTFSPSTIVFFKDNGAGEGVANNFTKEAGEPALSEADLTFDYRPSEYALRFGFKTSLARLARYCLRLSGGESGITDTTGNALITSTNCFTTGDTIIDNTPPTIQFADADNYKMWIQFSEPMHATDEGYQGSILNKSYFTIQNPVGVTVSLSSATLTYRPDAMGLEISGLGLQTNQEFQVEVTTAQDRNGNIIVDNNTTNIAKGIVQNSTNTGGYVGGYESPDFNSTTNFGNYGISPERCRPRSLSAGKTTSLECEFPAPTSLATHSTIILTFPVGFDLTNVVAVAAANSFMNADLNGPDPGITTISGVVVNTSSKTVTVTLNHSGTAMATNDQLRFELAGLINPTTSGEKSLSAIVKDAEGVKRGETIYFPPFTITAAGSLSVSGTVCKGTTSGGICGEGDTGIINVNIFLDSMGGHEGAVTDATGNFSFTGLSAGQYALGIMMDPSTANNVGGGANFQKITLSDASKTDVDFKLVDLAATGKTLTVNITGGPATTEMDVFCFAPGSYQFSAPVMTVVTTNGSGVAAGTLKLQPNTTYECGVGPHIPFQSMTAGGPPPMPDFTFMPPKPQTVNVGSTDLAITIALVVADYQVKGKVVDGSGSGVANVFIDARPMGCFDTTTGEHKECQGSGSKTKSDGTFILNVTQGTYGISACSPGMPCSNAEEVTVKADTSNVETDSNATADVYNKGTLLTGVGLTLKIAKTDVTIAGQVQDEDGNGIKYGFVDAQKVTSGDTCQSFVSKGDFTGSPTDATGNFTLYVSNGTWRVAAHAASYGEVACSIITVSGDTSLTGQNLKATAGDYGTISGTVTKASTAVQGAQINCYGSSGANQAISGADGVYSMKMKAGTGYTCDGFLPGAGPLTPVTNQTVVAGQTTTVDLSMGNPGTITINLGATMNNAFCDARDSNGRGDGTGQNSNGVYTIKVPAGTYNVRCGNPKYGSLGTQSVIVTAGGASNVDFSSSAPTLYTVSGRVTDGTNNLNGATVTFTDKTNGRMAFVQSDAKSGSDNNVSVGLPAGTYYVIASKSGYVDSSTAETLVVSATTSFATRVLTKAQAQVLVIIQQGGTNYNGNGRVVATDSTGKVATAEIDRTITSGTNVTLVLTNGTWSVMAFADNGKKTASASTVTVASNIPSPTTLTLTVDTAISGFLGNDKKQQSITPTAGGLFRDSTVGANFEINIPGSVLSTSDSTSGTIETKLDSSLAINTLNTAFVGTAAVIITAKDSSGNVLDEFTSEGKAVTLKIPYTDADVLAAGVSESMLVVASWNETAQEWETLSTTVDTVNNVLTAQTTHFSAFAPVAPETGAPTTPTGLAAVANSYSSVTLTWTATSGATGYDIYRSTTPDGSFARLGSEPTVGAVTTYTDSSVSASTTYYYKISAKNAVGESAASSAVSATTGSAGGGGGGGSIPGPSITSTAILINNNQTTTDTRAVTLKFAVSDATQMLIANDSSFAGAVWRTYATSLTWTLTEGVGTKTVYAQFKNTYGASSSTASDSITLTAKTIEPTPEPAKADESKKGSSDSFQSKVVLPNNVKVRDLIQGSDGVMYFVSAVDTIRLISSSEIFQSLGYSKESVINIADDIVNGLKKGAAIVSSRIHPDGSLIKYSGKSEVYLLENGKKRLITSVSAFTAAGYEWRHIVGIKNSEKYMTGKKIEAVSSDTSKNVSKVVDKAQVFKSYLSLGTVNDEVLLLQQKLKTLGFFPSDMDTTGYFGQITQGAVKAFQAANNIIPLGVVGPATRAALNK